VSCFALIYVAVFFFNLYFISHCTAEECREIPAPIEGEASNRCADRPRNSDLALQTDLVYKKIRKQLTHIHIPFPVC